MRSRHRTSLTIATAVGALALAALIALALGAFGTSSPPQLSLHEERALAEGGHPTVPPHGRPVSVTVAAAAAGPAVPRGFLGLSFEASATPLLASYSHGGNLAGFMRSLGPGVLRLGGVSADQRVAWVPEGTPRPAWASVGVTPQDLADLAEPRARDQLEHPPHRQPRLTTTRPRLRRRLPVRRRSSPPA